MQPERRSMAQWLLPTPVNEAAPATEAPATNHADDHMLEREALPP
jgi:hypothetical protein